MDSLIDIALEEYSNGDTSETSTEDLFEEMFGDEFGEQVYFNASAVVFNNGMVVERDGNIFVSVDDVQINNMYTLGQAIAQFESDVSRKIMTLEIWKKFVPKWHRSSDEREHTAVINVIDNLIVLFRNAK